MSESSLMRCYAVEQSSSAWTTLEARCHLEKAVMADPYQFFSSEQIATASRCPLAAVQAAWPRLVAQMALCGENDRMTQIAMIGTIAIETASPFRWIHEYR